MTPEEIVKARQIINKANRGPWEHDHDIGRIWDVSIKDEHLIIAEQCGQEDAAFIAAARTGWPAALDEIERLNRVAISQETLLKTLGEMKNENERLQDPWRIKLVEEVNSLKIENGKLRDVVGAAKCVLITNAQTLNQIAWVEALILTLHDLEA